MRSDHVLPATVQIAGGRHQGRTAKVRSLLIEASLLLVAFGEEDHALVTAEKTYGLPTSTVSAAKLGEGPDLDGIAVTDVVYVVVKGMGGEIAVVHGVDQLKQTVDIQVRPRRSEVLSLLTLFGNINPVWRREN